MKLTRRLMAVFLAVIIVGAIVLVKGPDTSGLKAPSVSIWLVGITNQGKIDEHACFMVSNSSPFAVIVSEYYNVEVRTAAGKNFTNIHSFSAPEPLGPKKIQPVIGRFWVTSHQTSWRFKIPYERVESDWERISQKVRGTLYFSGIPVDPLPVHRSVIYTEWLNE